MVRVRVFRHGRDLRRYVLRRQALCAALRELGLADRVRLPEILGVDAARMRVVTTGVQGRKCGEDDLARRGAALAALASAAGVAAGYDAATVWKLAEGVARELDLDIRDALPREDGVPPGNLVFDGEFWWAVDF